MDDIYTKLVFTILPANEAVPTSGKYTGTGFSDIRDTSRNGSGTRFHDCCKVAGSLVTVIAGITLALGAALYTRKQ